MRRRPPDSGAPSASSGASTRLAAASEPVNASDRTTIGWPACSAGMSSPGSGWPMKIDANTSSGADGANSRNAPMTSRARAAG